MANSEWQYQAAPQIFRFGLSCWLAFALLLMMGGFAFAQNGLPLAPTGASSTAESGPPPAAIEPHGGPLRFALGLGGFSPRFIGKDTLVEPQHRPLTLTGNGNPDKDFLPIQDIPERFFVEFYVIPGLALGWDWSSVLGHRSTSFDTATLFNRNFAVPAKYMERVAVESNFLTLTWLPIEMSEFRFGLAGGVGELTYRYDQRIANPNSADCFFFGFLQDCQDAGESKYHVGTSVSSFATMAGAFLDLGWNALAIRVGVKYVDANLPRLKAVQPDVSSRTYTVSGTHVENYVSLRFGRSWGSE